MQILDNICDLIPNLIIYIIKPVEGGSKDFTISTRSNQFNF